jgi:hypothetical protein
MTQMPGIEMEQKSAGQSASKIFLRCGFMLRYVRTPNLYFYGTCSSLTMLDNASVDASALCFQVSSLPALRSN